jgi:hypothetical protein
MNADKHSLTHEGGLQEEKEYKDLIRHKDHKIRIKTFTVSIPCMTYLILSPSVCLLVFPSRRIDLDLESPSKINNLLIKLSLLGFALPKQNNPLQAMLIYHGANTHNI